MKITLSQNAVKAFQIMVTTLDQLGQIFFIFLKKERCMYVCMCVYIGMRNIGFQVRLFRWKSSPAINFQAWINCFSFIKSKIGLIVILSSYYCCKYVMIQSYKQQDMISPRVWVQIQALLSMIQTVIMGMILNIHSSISSLNNCTSTLLNF